MYRPILVVASLLSLSQNNGISPAFALAAASKTTGTILVTGGAGYIGSHTCLELLTEGNKVVVVDTLDNSSEESLRRVQKLTQCSDDMLHFRNVDIRDSDGLEKGEVYSTTT